MENHYWVKLNDKGIVAEVKRDLDLEYTVPGNKLNKHSFYVGVFEAENMEDAIHIAKQAYLSYKSPS